MSKWKNNNNSVLTIHRKKKNYKWPNSVDTKFKKLEINLEIVSETQRVAYIIK